MKIGILTYHNTVNYGANYQVYALQQYINSIGKDCEIVDYNSETLKNRYDINPLHAKNFKQMIKRIIFYGENKRTYKRFNTFKSKNMKISSKEYNESNISEADEIYDCFIAGSDQIWNFNLSGNDENYFMMFTKNKEKRNSYAASIGSSVLTKEQEVKLATLLESQNRISVRETQGLNLIKKVAPNVSANQNIDPVFLLNAEQWCKIKSDKETEEKYILVYEVAYTPNLHDAARKLSEKTGYKIYYASASNRRIKGFKNINDLSPEEFLNVIYNAQYIITSSFHGMAMSIIFNKKFFYDLPAKTVGSFSSRLESLAKILEVEDRKLEKDRCPLEDEINYSIVNARLEAEVEKSKKYIDSILEKNEK